MIEIKLRVFAKKYLQETPKALQKDFQSRCIPCGILDVMM